MYISFWFCLYLYYYNYCKGEGVDNCLSTFEFIFKVRVYFLIYFSVKNFYMVQIRDWYVVDIRGFQIFLFVVRYFQREFNKYQGSYDFGFNFIYRQKVKMLVYNFKYVYIYRI